MAVKQESVIGGGVGAWSTHRCEDYVVIDGLLRLRDVEPYDKDMTSFVDRFLGQGQTITDNDLEMLNSRLRACGGEEVRLFESQPDSYCRQKGYGKANARNAILRAISGMSDSKRRETMIHYRSEAEDMQRGGANGGKANGRSAAKDAETPIVVGAGEDAARQAEPVRVVGQPAASGASQFELTFLQTVERVGRVVVTASDLSEAVAAAQSIDDSDIDWSEAVPAVAPRVTGVREV